jgi:methylenetetrahydrofolate reductase (NADPH)
MKIIDALTPGTPFISLEFFPPKERAEWPGFFRTVERLAGVNPLFASVTYGAGGTTQGDTLEIVSRLQQEFALETMAHLTCVGAEPERIGVFLDSLSAAGVDNVLALRGDLPKDADFTGTISGTLRNASDLVALVRRSHPWMGVGVAGYPETHPEADSPESDLNFLRFKLDQGGDFVVTQLFFDNRFYFDFVRRVRAMGVGKPIIPGILPVVSLKVIQRIISLCGASIPASFLAELEEADRSGGTAAVQKAGVAFARRQAADLLAAGAPGVHLYTLNRSEAVLELVDGLLPRSRP